MNTYKIKIKYENEIEANSEDEAREKFFSEMEENNEKTDIFLDEHISIKEMCPHCGIELENKMIDIDGTNLEEHNICPKCGYGMPTLH